MLGLPRSATSLASSTFWPASGSASTTPALSTYSRQDDSTGISPLARAAPIGSKVWGEVWAAMLEDLEAWEAASPSNTTCMVDNHKSGGGRGGEWRGGQKMLLGIEPRGAARCALVAPYGLQKETAF